MFTWRNCLKETKYILDYDFLYEDVLAYSLCIILGRISLPQIINKNYIAWPWLLLWVKNEIFYCIVPYYILSQIACFLLLSGNRTLSRNNIVIMQFLGWKLFRTIYCILYDAKESFANRWVLFEFSTRMSKNIFVIVTFWHMFQKTCIRPREMI